MDLLLLFLSSLLLLLLLLLLGSWVFGIDLKGGEDLIFVCVSCILHSLAEGRNERKAISPHEGGG